MQNVPYLVDNFTKYRIGPKPVKISELKQSQNPTDKAFVSLLIKFTVYDFMSDRIVTIDDVVNQGTSVYVADVGIRDLVPVDSNTYVVWKESVMMNDEYKGSGMMYPHLVRTDILKLYTDLSLKWTSGAKKFFEVDQYSKSTPEARQLIAKFDEVRTLLAKGGKDDVIDVREEHMKKPIYKDSAIHVINQVRQRIDNALSKVSVPVVKHEDISVRLARAINLSVPSDKAINVKSGKTVGRKSSSYVIRIFTVKTSSGTKDVAFAFSKDINQDEYIKILTSQFGAVEATGSQPDIQYQSSIGLKTRVVLEKDEYMYATGGIEGLNRYMAMANKITNPIGSMDIGATSVQHEVAEEEPQEEEDVYEDEEEYDED